MPQFVYLNKSKKLYLIKNNFYKFFIKVSENRKIYRLLVNEIRILAWKSRITLKISIKVTF